MFERYTAVRESDCYHCGRAILTGTEAVAVGPGWRAATWHRACHEKSVARALAELRSAAEDVRKLGVPCDLTGGLEIAPVAVTAGA